MGYLGRVLKQGNKDFILGKYNEPIPFFIVKKGAQDFFEAIFSKNPGRVPHEFCTVPYVLLSQVHFDNFTVSFFVSRID